MKTVYRPDLKAHLTVDEKDRVRHILYTHQSFPSEESNARLAAAAFVNQTAEVFQIPLDQLKHLQQPVSFLDPREQEIEYRFYEVKKFFASATYAYYQTIHNVPVWHGGMTVTVKEGPHRITHADNYGHDDLQVQLPPEDATERVRGVLIQLNSTARNGRRVVPEGEAPAEPTSVAFQTLFPVLNARGVARRGRAQTPEWADRMKITRGLFYVYRYDAKERQTAYVDPGLVGSETKPAEIEVEHEVLTLPLPPVPSEITDGEHYLVVEIIFHLGNGVRDRLNWKALVEVATGAILWLRAMISGVCGLVFAYDPKTATGILANTADSTNAVLNPLRVNVELTDLNPPVMGTQSLAGSHVTIIDDDSPTVPPPSQPTGTAFDYDARTNNFAAVNAYYHANNVFAVIESLGFNLSMYFNDTAFPVHVDHRASTSAVPGASGIEINAFCMGDGPGGVSGDGIGLVGFCLSDDTGTDDTTVNPLGRAVDKWVHWHEIGGHGILWDHVNFPNFGFAHSAGDSLAAFQNDPESHLRALPQRFQYAPFRTWPAGSERFFNRTVASGWGWGGPQDLGGYKSEQILATTLFRVYQALGGDANEVNKRWHASRVSTYLVLNAVGKLTAGTNPSNAEGFYNVLVAADTDDWISEGLAGGAYAKVIRWSFEKQNLWSGAPPAVDLYIDDGRGGEYPYQAVHWNNASVWNRQSADGLTGHQNAVDSASNFAYVKVKNRGTTNAEGVVKVYHCKPGAGLTWPTDFVQAGPAAGLATGTVLANNGNEVIVGPFTWTPNVNVYGHDCLLAIVTADGDSSNVSNLEPGQTIAEWRLVPHDNNIGQRNVSIVPGGGGSEAPMAALDGAVFFAGNNLNKLASMQLRVDMPRVLASKGWRLQFVDLPNKEFRLGAGEKRRIEWKLAPGASFTAEEIKSAPDRNISVTLFANGMLVGGMAYQVDPDLKEPSGGKRRSGIEYQEAAEKLLEAMKLSGGQKVKQVHVTHISLDVELDQ